MTRLISLLTAIARIATGLCFGAIIVAVVLQLLGRSGVIPTVIWTEELTRFSLLWLVACGAGLGLRSGDLVFFGLKGRVNHVGIYVGEGRFVHAPSTGGTVRLDSLSGPYWKDHYTGAKRILR